jgi:Exopolyphosphatase-related proteins
MIDGAKLKKFISLLKDAQSVALICHVNPDCDTLGSALALRRVLLKLNVPADVFCDDNPPAKFSFLPDMNTVNSGNLSRYEAAIAVDCSAVDRFVVSGKYFKHAKVKLVVDHHKTNDSFADYTLCDPDAAATAEIVFAIIRKMEVFYVSDLLDDETAHLLYAALVTDSGCFSFSNTRSETFNAASELKRFNFNAAEVAFKLIKEQTVSVFRLKARVLSAAKFFNDDRIGLIVFKQAYFKETGTEINNTEGIINEIINIDSVQLAVAVTEVYDKYFKVSFRTKAPYDASECASAFGGGGHNRAAGCTVSGYFEDVLDKILKVGRDLINA